MSDLPDTWTSANILELSKIIRGVTYSKNDAHDEPDKGLIPILRAMNITERGLVFDDLVYVPRKLVKDEQVIKAGDVVAAISSGSITVVGKAKQTRSDLDAAFGAFCAVLRPIPEIDPKYFGHFFGTQYYRFTVSSLARGVNINNLKREHFAEIDIPVPPLPEQKRIAEKLDSLLARVDSCQTHLERVPQILKRFRQSVLAAATSGRLTEDWREENSVIGNWRLVNLREVATSFNYGTSAKSHKSGKMPVLRMGNIQDGKLDWTDLVFTSDKDEIEKYKLVKGDVLFNRTNSPEWVGKTAVYKGEQPAIFAGYLIRVKCGDELLPDFINYCLNSPMGRDWRWQVKSDGVSQSNINAQKLADFEFELPPIEEQAEIVRRVGKLFAYAERLDARYASASEHVGRLSLSLLGKAFRGELV